MCDTNYKWDLMNNHIIILSALQHLSRGGFSVKLITNSLIHFQAGGNHLREEAKVSNNGNNII